MLAAIDALHAAVAQEELALQAAKDAAREEAVKLTAQRQQRGVAHDLSV